MTADEDGLLLTCYGVREVECQNTLWQPQTLDPTIQGCKLFLFGLASDTAKPDGN